MHEDNGVVHAVIDSEGTVFDAEFSPTTGLLQGWTVRGTDRVSVRVVVHTTQIHATVPDSEFDDPPENQSP